MRWSHLAKLIYASLDGSNCFLYLFFFYIPFFSSSACYAPYFSSTGTQPDKFWFTFSAILFNLNMSLKSEAREEEKILRQ